MNQPPPPPTPPAEDALIGSVLADRYKVLHRIGEGGMGAVYVGEHVTLGKRMALKILKAQLAHDKTTVERFLREAKATSSIEHENIVDILDFGHTPTGSAFFVMEFLRGQELTEVIADSVQMPWSRAKGVLTQLCFGLAAAHDLGIVHRDMKPGNVFLIKKSGRADFVKILDFGIAKVQDAAALTRAGMVFGTAAYMAPEQATASEIDGRADMYALACMAFEMLTGRLPFDAKHPVKMLNCHIREPAPSMRTVAPDANVPEAVDNVILKALAKRPEDRYVDMYDFARALDAIPVGEPAPSQPRPVASAVDQPRQPAPPQSPPLSVPLPPVPMQGQQPAAPRQPQSISSGGQRSSSHAGAIGSSELSERTEPRRVMLPANRQRPAQVPPSPRPRRNTIRREGGPPGQSSGQSSGQMSGQAPGHPPARAPGAPGQGRQSSGPPPGRAPGPHPGQPPRQHAGPGAPPRPGSNGPPRPQARRAPAAATMAMTSPPPLVPGSTSSYPPELPGLAWIFVGLAESAEDDLTNRHLLEVAKRLWPWAQALTLDELNALVRHTLADYRALPDVATRGVRTREYNMELAQTLPRPRLAEILTTLYSIASDDGRVRDRELRFIVNCTQQLGLSPDPRLLAVGFLFVMISAADGHIDDQEIEVLREQSKQWAPRASIAERAVVLRWAMAEFKRRPVLEERIQTAREAADQLAASTDAETLRRIINGMWRIAGADGHISPDEKAFINDILHRFRLQ